MNFCTTINCMDGRVQLPVIQYLQKRFHVSYVDSITEPGPNLILAEQTHADLVRSIYNRLKISVRQHGSVGVAVVGHYDCAGNPSTQSEQTSQTIKSVRAIRQEYSDIEILGLWVDENWQVFEVPEGGDIS